MAEDTYSKFIRKVRRRLVQQQVVLSSGAAKRFVRVQGLEKAAKRVGLEYEPPQVEMTEDGDVSVGGSALTLGS